MIKKENRREGQGDDLKGGQLLMIMAPWCTIQSL